VSLLTGSEGSIASSATSWSDTFADEFGFHSMNETVVISGDVVLTQIEALAHPSHCILSIVAQADGKVYAGGCGPSLHVYDPDTGIMSDLGAPVPGEPY
jgi:hypothetical protein